MRQATYADLEALPPEMVGELIDGTLIAMPRPALGHASVALNLGADLRNPYGRGRGGPGGWVILAEPELHLGKDVLVPDLAGWQRDRLATLPTADAPHTSVAPDWVCEILSPRTARIDKIWKRRVYAREKVGFIWHVEPVERILTAYRFVAPDYQELGVFSPDETPTIRVPPFDAVELEFALWWDAVQPPPSTGP